MAEGLLERRGDRFRTRRRRDAFLVRGRPAYAAHGLKYAEDLYPAWGRPRRSRADRPADHRAREHPRRRQGEDARLHPRDARARARHERGAAARRRLQRPAPAARRRRRTGHLFDRAGAADARPDARRCSTCPACSRSRARSSRATAAPTASRCCRRLPHVAVRLRVRRRAAVGHDAPRTRGRLPAAPAQELRGDGRQAASSS